MAVVADTSRGPIFAWKGMKENEYLESKRLNRFVRTKVTEPHSWKRVAVTKIAVAKISGL